jgi:formate dehydrogenase maturation protein FdhE
MPWKCPSCGNEWSDQFTKCLLCDKNLSTEIPCGRSGNIIDTNIPVCLRCEGYIAIDHLFHGNLLVVTDRKVKR